MPWDGVRGPKLQQIGNRTVAAYTDIERVDYIDLPGTMTAALTSRVDSEEYKTRTLAMQAVYWAVGIHDPDFAHYGDKAVPKILLAKASWAVLSFKQVPAGDPDLRVAEQQAGVSLGGSKLYFFHIFKWGDQSPDPGNLRTVFVEVGEQVLAFVSGPTVLIKREGGTWMVDRSVPI
jgi:hypothetical protein